jgi:hypothetical protein
MTTFTLANVTANHTIAASFNALPLTIEFAFKPSDFHLDRKDTYVTGYLTTPPDYATTQFDAASIRLNGVVPVAPGTTPAFEKRQLKVKFLRTAVIPTVTPGSNVPMTVTGLIAGRPVNGACFIKVRAPKLRMLATTLPPGAATTVSWDVPDAAAPTVALMSTFDDGATWNVEATGLPNVGSCAWTAPDVATESARLAVIQVYEVDATGAVSEAEYAMSDAFTITGGVLGVGDRGARLALSPANPVSGPFVVGFSLASAATARLEVFDVTGRTAAAREIGGLGAGRQSLSLGILPAGVYVVRLSQSGRSVSARVAVIR